MKMIATGNERIILSGGFVMELRWVNKTTKEIGIVNVTDDDSKILGIVGYEHCEEDDFTEEYRKFVKKYEDIIKKTVSLQQLRKMRQIILKLYDKLF